MYCKSVFMFLWIGYVVSQEVCYHKQGTTGVCKNIRNCQPAIDDIKKRITPQVETPPFPNLLEIASAIELEKIYPMITRETRFAEPLKNICGFEGTDPIVCCVENTVLTTSTIRPSMTTKIYVPPVYEYVDSSGYVNDQCEPIPTSLTSLKIGRKAFDKCKDYQENLVYQCSNNQALAGGLSRTNECGHSSDELIIGGENATVREFPHMALLGFGDRDNLQWLCGGSVISENFILTAGHCTYERQNGNVTHVLVGVLKRSEMHKAKIHRIKRIIKHPEYKPPIKYNDIALLELEVPLSLSKEVVPACLHIGDQVKDDRASATGWGATVYKSQTSNAEVLQKVTLTKFSTAECATTYPVHRHTPNGFDPNTQMCYGDYTQSKDTCQGDSGGPLQIKSKKLDCMYIIIGVTSFGRACGSARVPGIYTKVASYTPWIESIVWP